LSTADRSKISNWLLSCSSYDQNEVNAMGHVRVIRKYVNRRLYDTQESRYVNLDDLRRLILDDNEIRVTDRASGDDITTPVLLQIVGDAQRGGKAVFEPDLLCQIIRVQSRGDDPAVIARLNQAFRQALIEGRKDTPTNLGGQP
jgi:polyhydroxyalkanoate synthesis repressor PhaR